jgi:hypothetical protein
MASVAVYVLLRCLLSVNLLQQVIRSNLNMMLDTRTGDSRKLKYRLLDALFQGRLPNQTQLFSVSLNAIMGNGYANQIGFIT